MFMFLPKTRYAWRVTKFVIAMLTFFSVHVVSAQQIVVDGTYAITNACNSKPLGLKNGNPNPWDNAVLSDTATTWQVTSASDGSYILRASGTDSALQTSYERTATGTDVDLFTYWGGISQRWLISDGGNNTYKHSTPSTAAQTAKRKYGSMTTTALAHNAGNSAE
jgi:hypothetical protein